MCVCARVPLGKRKRPVRTNAEKMCGPTRLLFVAAVVRYSKNIRRVRRATDGHGGGREEAQRRVPGECFSRMYNVFRQTVCADGFRPFHSGRGNVGRLLPSTHHNVTSMRVRRLGDRVPSAVRRARVFCSNRGNKRRLGRLIIDVRCNGRQCR